MGHHIATLGPKLILAIKNDDNDVKIVYKRLSTGKIEKFEVIKWLLVSADTIIQYWLSCMQPS